MAKTGVLATALMSSLIGAGSAHANIMCDPGWLYGRPATSGEAVIFMKQLAKTHEGRAGKGGEQYVCEELQRFRIFVNGNCISDRFLPEVEAAFTPYACEEDVLSKK